MKKKLILLLTSLLLFTGCTLDLKGGSSDSAADAESLPVITLPSLPASVDAYGGKIRISSIKFDGKYNKTQKSMNGTVSMMIEGSDNGTDSVCLVDFKVYTEDDILIDTGNMGDGEVRAIGEKYEGKFYVMDVEPGKKYTLKFVKS